MIHPLSNYETSRRAFLRKSLGATAALALPSVLVACGNGDSDVFASAEADSTTTTPQETPTTSSSATSSTGAAEAVPTTESSPASPGESLPLAISFTYSMASGGKQLNPYLAVWVESTDGTLLRTVELWYQQDRKGANWLDDLKDWWRVDQARINSGGSDTADVVSSATRSPGAYALIWDGLDENGDPVSHDEVVVCIESARERGPHSFVSETIQRSGLTSAVALADDGELQGLTVAPA